MTLFSKLGSWWSKNPPAAPVVPVADVKGRLLTPDEGCGYSKVQNTRIVGGSKAKNGKLKFNPP